MAINSKLACLLRTSILIKKNTNKTTLIVIVIVEDGYTTIISSSIIAVVNLPLQCRIKREERKKRIERKG